MEISSINTQYQQNFNPDKIPPGSEGFYNSAAFASNMAKVLGNAVQAEERAQLKGLQEIKKSIDGTA